MKNRKYQLVEWYTETIPTSFDDFNWDKIRQLVGNDHIDWIMNRPKTQCQIIYETTNRISRLVAEFYCERTELEYCLKWAK